MGIFEKNFGMTSKGEATLYTIINKQDMSISVTDFGATLVQVLVPKQNGEKVDVVLGYDDAKGYEEGTVFFGASVGRCANRIGTASFTLNGKTYELTKNDNGNNLHSGLDFYNKRIWQVAEAAENHVTFVLHSPDGDQGYPGTLDMKVTYELTDENEVKITYDAVPDADTIINMTNHSYFNLDGHDSGSILEQEVQIDADAFTRADAESIPTGELVDVTGTPMDFRQKKAIGRDIESPYEALIFGRGYDHNWVLNQKPGFKKVAEMCGKKSGITMHVFTDLPGMQLYTANFVEHEKGTNGAVYQMRHAACFETQYFPDAIHKEQFASPVCRKGEPYHTCTMYQFVVE